ncbi:SMP-30/gluconolactonase/LRE family protein [Roseibium sp. HPY-6]|uniref:SMP-30/gluconolactonase/LRE family protein n=1 Tax=Roseibium sp. HPY-6 TaxID=3229852 RepID=UPI0033905D42
MKDLVIPICHLERLFDTCLWAEGPAYLAASDCVVWSDIPNNRILQWVEGLGTRTLSAASNHANGNTIDGEGRLVSCEHLSRAVTRREHDGTRTVLASHFDGKRLNSPNDVVVKSDGTIWFTDPTYGILTDYEGERADPEQDGCYVYRLQPETGEINAVIRTMVKPNGLAFSPDERRLYVSDTGVSHQTDGPHHIKVFDLVAGEKVQNERVFAEIAPGVPDGFRLDEFGNVWTSSGNGVQVFSPEGEFLGRIAVPEAVSNLTFGGPKNNRLFITATTSLYAIYVGVRGSTRRSAF